MSDIARAVMPQEFDLRPEDLHVEDRYARRWKGDEEQEAKRIESLAKMIDKVGQLYPALVTPTVDNKGFILIDGHRRRRAVILINERRSQNGQELLKLSVRQELGGDLVKKSLVANIERESYGPMELAMRIQELRTEKKWEGFKGTKKIADYLGIDPATVTQYEKFTGMNTELQGKLGEGVISAQSALEMIGIPADEQPQVLKRAAEIQKKTEDKVSPRAKQRRAEKEKKTGKSQAKRIERPAIRQAIKEKTGKKIITTLTRKELIESLEVFDGPQYGHPNGAVRQFITYFTDTFAVGRGSIKKMRSLFDQMTAKASKGTQVPAEMGKMITVNAKKKTKAKKPKAVKKAKTTKAPKKKK